MTDGALDSSLVDHMTTIWLVRDALEDFLASTRENEFTKQLMGGYQRVPQGAADEWGALARQLREGTHRTRRRLDAEEESAGGSW